MLNSPNLEIVSEIVIPRHINPLHPFILPNLNAVEKGRLLTQPEWPKAVEPLSGTSSPANPAASLKPQRHRRAIFSDQQQFQPLNLDRHPTSLISTVTTADGTNISRCRTCSPACKLVLISYIALSLTPPAMLDSEARRAAAAKAPVPAPKAPHNHLPPALQPAHLRRRLPSSTMVPYRLGRGLFPRG